MQANQHHLFNLSSHKIWFHSIFRIILLAFPAADRNTPLREISNEIFIHISTTMSDFIHCLGAQTDKNLTGPERRGDPSHGRNVISPPWTCEKSAKRSVIKIHITSKLSHCIEYYSGPHLLFGMAQDVRRYPTPPPSETTLQPSLRSIVHKYIINLTFAPCLYDDTVSPSPSVSWKWRRIKNVHNP